VTFAKGGDFKELTNTAASHNYFPFLNCTKLQTIKICRSYFKYCSKT